MNIKEIEVNYEVVSPSEIAHEKSKKFKHRHHVYIFQALLKYGEMNCEQIAEKTCLDRYQIGRRMKEMVLLDVIEITGKKPYKGKILTHYKCV